MKFHFYHSENRLRNPLMCLLAAVLFGASPVSGQTYVWWEAEPVSEGALVLTQGEGMLLELACDVGLQPADPVFVWDVTMRLKNDVPMWGWSLDLLTATDTVEAVSYDYGEKVFSPEGVLQTYVPLPTIIEFATVGAGRNLTDLTAAFGLNASPTYEASFDGEAWSILKFRLTKTITPYDSGVAEIFGETGPYAWADDTGWSMAVMADNEEMEVWDPGTRYPDPLIVIESPQGPLWSPELEQPLYPPDEEPEAPVDTPDDDSSEPEHNNANDNSATWPDPANPPNPTANGQNNLNGNTDSPVATLPQVPVSNDPKGVGVAIHPPARPPVAMESTLTGACGAQSVFSMGLMVLGLTGFRPIIRKHRRPR